MQSWSLSNVGDKIHSASQPEQRHLSHLLCVAEIHQKFLKPIDKVHRRTDTGVFQSP